MNLVDVVVNSCEEDRVSDWSILNKDWYGQFVNSIRYKSHRGDRLDSSIMRGNVCNEFIILDGQTDRKLPVLYVEAGWKISGNWLSVIEKANSVRNLASATGRLVRSTPRSSSLSSDMTPELIAGSVTEWSFSNSVDGVVCRQLPSNVLWVSSASRSAFEAAIRFEYDEGPKQFFDNTNSLFSPGVHVYLPGFEAVSLE